jgi:hypothetical protein
MYIALVATHSASFPIFSPLTLQPGEAKDRVTFGQALFTISKPSHARVLMHELVAFFTRRHGRYRHRFATSS